MWDFWRSREWKHRKAVTDAASAIVGGSVAGTSTILEAHSKSRDGETSLYITSLIGSALISPICTDVRAISGTAAMEQMRSDLVDAVVKGHILMMRRDPLSPSNQEFKQAISEVYTRAEDLYEGVFFSPRLDSTFIGSDISGICALLIADELGCSDDLGVAINAMMTVVQIYVSVKVPRHTKKLSKTSWNLVSSEG